MSQDPLRHRHPDVAQRLLRAAAATILSACQCLLDLPGFPHRTRVLARAARTAPPHARPHRCLQQTGTNPDGRDQPASTHQPRTHDWRNRKQRAGRRRRCRGLTTLTSSSLRPAAGQQQPTNARCQHCDVWTKPVYQSLSTRWPAKPGSPGPGSTVSRTYALKSSASEPGDALRHRTLRSRIGNAPPIPPCSSDCRPLPSASSICRPKTTNSVRRWPTRSVSSEPTPFTAITATRRQQNPPPSSASADHASKTPSATHNRWSQPRICQQL